MTPTIRVYPLNTFKRSSLQRKKGLMARKSKLLSISILKRKVFRLLLIDYLTSTDLTDAYFSLRIDSDYCKFLRFTWRGILYEFKVLCFGLASAPRVFTKVLKPVYAFFRQHGIRCIYYIDDSLVMNQEFSECLQNTNFIAERLVFLGYGINF